jgi:chemotaxis protein methyltransferase CheR
MMGFAARFARSPPQTLGHTNIKANLVGSPGHGDSQLSERTSKADDVLANLLERGLGIASTPHSLDAFADACRTRASALGLLESDYLRLLTHGGNAARAEWMAVAPAVVVGETFLFRDAQLWQLVESTLFPTIAPLARPIWLWSAGCSTGEEAYTLALIAHRVFGRDGYRVLGTDVNPKAVAAARVGAYGQWSLRGVTDERRDSLTVSGTQTVRVPDEVKSLVRFETQNLNDASSFPPGGMASFELVVCRNVLIYMSQPARAAIIDRLAASVTPGGVLILGHGEAAGIDVKDLTVERHDAGVVYRKPLTTAATNAPDSHARPHPAKTAAKRPAKVARLPLDQARQLPKAAERPPAHVRRPAEKEPLLADGRAADKERYRTSLSEAMRAAHAGKMVEAEGHAVAAVSAEPLDPEPHVLLGALLMARGAMREAEAELRRALFLDPVYVPALWQAGNLYGITNRKRQAVFAFARALTQLEGMQPDVEALPFDKLTVSELSTLLRAEIGERADA